ncbi:MAG: bifunctional 3-deoxy-7-phosphoheptulonate synthase/chorismate mutase [Chloroflexota bacterium]
MEGEGNGKSIEKLRVDIDSIDYKIIDLLLKRNEIAHKVIKLKAASGAPVFDEERERLIIEKLSRYAGGRLSNDFIEKLARVFLWESKSIERPNSFRRRNDKIFSLLATRPAVIAGPCAVESEEQIMAAAAALSAAGVKFLRGGAFKPRTSPDSFQGLGDEGIRLLKAAAAKYGMFSVTEFLEINEIERHYDNVDIIQIGSRNMTSSGFLKYIAKISSQDCKPIILKRGFGSTIKEFLLARDYLARDGNPNIALCLRGIRTFEQIESSMRNTADLAAILELKSLTGSPVFFDPSHSAGRADFVPQLAEAALALGADGIMFECHPAPEKALCDGGQCLTLVASAELSKKVLSSKP